MKSGEWGVLSLQVAVELYICTRCGTQATPQVIEAVQPERAGYYRPNLERVIGSFDLVARATSGRPDGWIEIDTGDGLRMFCSGCAVRVRVALEQLEAETRDVVKAVLDRERGR